MPAKLPDIPKGRIDLVKAIQLRAKGASYQDIANVMECSKQAVQERVAKFLKDCGDLEEIKAFKEMEATVQSGIRFKYAKHLLDDEVVKNTSGYQAAMIYGTLYDKERLERGLSTSNQAVIYASAIESAFSQKTEKPVVEAEIIPDPDTSEQKT